MSIILTTIVALEHFYIFYLESIATQSDATSRVFNMEKEELAHPSVSSLFKNQGIYKALLARGADSFSQICSSIGRRDESLST